MMPRSAGGTGAKRSPWPSICAKSLKGKGATRRRRAKAMAKAKTAHKRREWI